MKESKVVFTMWILAGICIIMGGIYGKRLILIILGILEILVEVGYTLWLKNYNKKVNEYEISKR